MDGFVTTRHLFTHSAVIVKEFGTVCLLRCFWRTVTADHAVTFLECTLPIHWPVPSLGPHTSLDSLDVKPPAASCSTPGDATPPVISTHERHSRQTAPGRYLS